MEGEEGPAEQSRLLARRDDDDPVVGEPGRGGLGGLDRDDGSSQVSSEGRPLYFYSGDAAPGETRGQGLGNQWWLVPFTQLVVPLYDSSTQLDPPLQEETSAALITRFADRARDRHAREDQFQQYDHYLDHYWEHRTAAVEIVDTIGKDQGQVAKAIDRLIEVGLVVKKEGRLMAQ